MRKGSSKSSKLPLEGVRVLDLSGSYAGPYASMMLADMGAEVVKVERPEGDECRAWGPPFVRGESPWFLSVNRNKKSIVLNMKSPADAATLRKLIRRAHVFLHNMRPSAVRRLGQDYPAVRAINPGIVYCAISGFGQNGPLRDAACYDLIAEGIAGTMSLIPPLGGVPQKVGTAASDIVTGMIAAFAIVSALYRGEGAFIDTALMDGQIAFLAPKFAQYLTTGCLPQLLGGAESPIAIYQAFRTKDGFLTLGVGNDAIFARLSGVLGLAPDPRFASNADRKRHRDELVAALERALAQKTTSEWIGIFRREGVPAGPVNTLDQAVLEPQVKARKMVRRVRHPKAGSIRLPGIPWKLAGAQERFRPAPTLGQHTKEVLASWI